MSDILIFLVSILPTFQSFRWSFRCLPLFTHIGIHNFSRFDGGRGGSPKSHENDLPSTKLVQFYKMSIPLQISWYYLCTCCCPAHKFCAQSFPSYMHSITSSAMKQKIFGRNSPRKELAVAGPTPNKTHDWSRASLIFQFDTFWKALRDQSGTFFCHWSSNNKSVREKVIP